MNVIRLRIVLKQVELKHNTFEALNVSYLSLKNLKVFLYNIFRRIQ